MTGIDSGTPLHHPAQPALGQLLRGVLSGEHDIDQNAHGVDISTHIRLGQAILLRRGEPGSTQNLGVPLRLRLMDPCGVKVNENRVMSAQNDVLRFNIPVDCTQAVKNPETAADLSCDLFGFRR